jgi:hypothetical protein
LLLPTVILLPLLGLTDKTLFLSARGEHYYTALHRAGLLSVSRRKHSSLQDPVGGGMAMGRHVQAQPAFSRGWWAVMQSNSPITRFGGLRRLLYCHYPDDRRPFRLVHGMAHAGTVLEYSFPLVLLASSGGLVTIVALCAMLAVHTFITTSVPMGLPIEWNLMMVYGGFFLFGHHAATGIREIHSPTLSFLVSACFLIPLIGNLSPSAFSFLCAMRYYAGIGLTTSALSGRLLS